MRTVLAQSPSLFVTEQEFAARRDVAKREPWAKRDLAALLQEADAFPQSYESRFGLKSVELPPEGGQWLHWYVCPETGTPLVFHPPNHNVCPDTGKEYSGPPFDQVPYQLRNDALGRAALTLGLAYRLTGQQRYAKQAVELLIAFADKYSSWPLHDNHGKPSPNGGKAYSQTLDESIWLINIAWTYDLVRGASLLDAHGKEHIENDLLRAAYQTVSKAHKEPTYNIQSWINAAIAAVGFTLHDDALIHEAIDGPIGFRYQMKAFVREGFWLEGTFGYHFYALRALVDTAQMAAHAGMNLWQQEPALLTLFTSPLALVLPNGELPAFNDSNPVHIFDQDYLYEQAYAVSRDAQLLPVVLHNGRNSRDALLFGVEHTPPAPQERPVSRVFPLAGFAALRSSSSDLTVITKFGAHGGAHGHYDKLSFVLFSQGQVLGVDPGTQLYGLPLHRQWDSMTIAHNTLSVDGKRQAAANGKLLDWQTGPGWTAITMDAGPVYPGVQMTRSLVLTGDYCLLQDRVQSGTADRHTVDWMYHNRGVLTLAQPTGLRQTTGLFAENGYEILRDVQEAATRGPVDAHFASRAQAEKEHPENPNSPEPTLRARNPDRHSTPSAKGTALMNLTIAADPQALSEVFTGVAPGGNLTEAVPFVMVRRSGNDVRFTALLSPREGITVQDQANGTVRIDGPVHDSIQLSAPLSVRHAGNP